MSTTTVETSHVGQSRQELLTLIAEHEQALLAYAESLLNDRYMAEDIVQETLIRAWPHAERLYSTEGSVRGWLLTVTRNLIIDRLRTAAVRRETVSSDDQDAMLPDHSDTVLASVEAASLLRQLPREHREVLLHTYLHDRSVQDTARILGIPTGTVKSRQHYALTSLRAKAPQ